MAATAVGFALVKSFDDLYAELAGKLAAGDPASGTVARVEAGVHEIGKKIVEEAAEVWMAAEYQTPEHAASRDQPAALPPPGADAGPGPDARRYLRPALTGPT